MLIPVLIACSIVLEAVSRSTYRSALWFRIQAHKLEGRE